MKSLVLIYFKWWSKLSIMQVFGDVELWVAPQSFADTFYILRGAIPSEDLQRAFEESLEFFNVCSIGMKDVREASHRQWPDYEDCLIAIAAESIDADVLLSRDKAGFKKLKIPVYSLEDFFRVVKDEYGLVYDEVEF